MSGAVDSEMYGIKHFVSLLINDPVALYFCCFLDCSLEFFTLV